LNSRLSRHIRKAKSEIRISSLRSECAHAG
jgi:hypothetical protein